MPIEPQTHEMPFAPDLSVIDIEGWLRMREADWESQIDFDMDPDFFIEEDAA